MPEAAQLALEQMNSVMLGGRNIKVSDESLHYKRGESCHLLMLVLVGWDFSSARRSQASNF